MKTETQQIIIITIGILALASIILQQNDRILELVIVGLLGFLSQKSLTDKQSEQLEQQLSGDGDVQ